MPKVSSRLVELLFTRVCIKVHNNLRSTVSLHKRIQHAEDEEQYIKIKKYRKCLFRREMPRNTLNKYRLPETNFYRQQTYTIEHTFAASRKISFVPEV